MSWVLLYFPITSEPRANKPTKDGVERGTRDASIIFCLLLKIKLDSCKKVQWVAANQYISSTTTAMTIDADSYLNINAANSTNFLAWTK